MNYLLPFAMAVACVLAAEVNAAEFEVRTWRGHQVIEMSGIIDKGSAEKFLHVVDEVAPLAHGYPVLLLNSRGGSVVEAFKISEILENHKFHTVIPDNAKCASACASIIFISGHLRTVEHFGALGQHSCSRNGIQDQECNDIISNHALRNGVSYGSVAAFVTFAPPSEIIWFSREDADGWGLTRYAGEVEGRFEKSEPRVIKMFTGSFPPAQAVWRIDFRDDGFEAFLRPSSDHERELELNIFCDENRRGRLFLGMEVHGAETTIRHAVIDFRVDAGSVSWIDLNPVINRVDPLVTELITEIPREKIINFLEDTDYIRIVVSLRPPYNPLIVTTFMAGSRRNVIFAANNCPNR